MIDPILTSFLEKQLEEGMALAGSSDLLELEPLRPAPVQRFVARFLCTGLVWREGRVQTAERFEIGIHFPPDYLRRVVPAEVLTLLSPSDCWHPSCLFMMICPGRLTPGTSLVEILHQCFEILTWRKVQLREDDSLNPAAAQWARANPERFPTDARPLRRRTLDLSFADVRAGAEPVA